jgi:hypothetical protein
VCASTFVMPNQQHSQRSQRSQHSQQQPRSARLPPGLEPEPEQRQPADQRCQNGGTGRPGEAEGEMTAAMVDSVVSAMIDSVHSLAVAEEESVGFANAGPTNGRMNPGAAPWVPAGEGGNNGAVATPLPVATQGGRRRRGLERPAFEDLTGLYLQPWPDHQPCVLLTPPPPWGGQMTAAAFAGGDLHHHYHHHYYAGSGGAPAAAAAMNVDSLVAGACMVALVAQPIRRTTKLRGGDKHVVGRLESGEVFTVVAVERCLTERDWIAARQGRCTALSLSMRPQSSFCNSCMGFLHSTLGERCRGWPLHL